MPNYENDGTQNAHIEQSNQDAKYDYLQKYRNRKAYEHFKHMPDYSTGRKENDHE